MLSWQKQHLVQTVLLLGVLFALTACTLSPLARRQKAYGVAAAHHWEALQLAAHGFVLTGFHNSGDREHDFLVVYIEGDGMAWKSRSRISDDPTPIEPVALMLAVSDPSPAILYLARPCQYVGNLEQSECRPRYWAQDRYGPEVLAAMDEGIDQVKTKIGAVKIGLVGYSGGGTVAALLAARRRDVAWLVTIAAPLDHRAWTTMHRVLPLYGSENPARLASSLQTIPQIHFVGGRDRKVPEEILSSYLSRMEDSSLAEIVVLPDFDHGCCWVDAWPALRRQHWPEAAGATRSIRPETKLEKDHAPPSP